MIESEVNMCNNCIYLTIGGYDMTYDEPIYYCYFTGAEVTTDIHIDCIAYKDIEETKD